MEADAALASTPREWMKKSERPRTGGEVITEEKYEMKSQWECLPVVGVGGWGAEDLGSSCAGWSPVAG